MKPTTPTVTAAENKKQWMTFPDVSVEISVSGSTLDKWRAEGNFPEFVKLPNGEMRLRRIDFEAWLDQLQKVA